MVEGRIVVKKFSKYELIKKAEIIVDIIILFIMLNSNLVIQLLLFTAAVIFMAIDFDIYHPRFWYAVVFYLYAISYPMLYLLGLLDSNYGCSQYLLPLQFLGLICFWIGTHIIKKSPKKTAKFKLTRNYSMPLSMIKAVLITGGFGMLLTAFMLLSGSFDNKYGIYSNGNIIIIFFLSYVYLHIIFTFFYWIYIGKVDKVVLFSLFVPCFQGVVSGERDVLFRILVMIALYLYSEGKLKEKYFLLLIPIAIIGIPLSADLKYILLNGAGGTFGFLNDANALLHDFFYSDFVTASRNLQLVLNAGIPSDYSWYSIFLSILARFVSITYETPLNYFNNYNYHGSFIGHGFTIIGEGIYYGTIWGVVVLMVAVGILAKKLHGVSKKSTYEKTIYLYSVPLFMYACRGELSTIVVPLIKYGIVSFVILELLCEFNNKSKRWEKRFINND